MLTSTSTCCTVALYVCLLSFVIVTIDSTDVSGGTCQRCTCRSNETHIVWMNNTPNTTTASTTTTASAINNCCYNNDNDTNTNNYYNCNYEPIAVAKINAYKYLLQTIRQFDLPFRCTLGFNDDNDDSILPDGLSDGLIGPTIDLAFQAKILFDYTDILPKDIFYEYVLNYANLNEGRTNWRPYFWNTLVQPLLLLPSSSTKIIEDGSIQLWTVSDVVTIFNKQMWTIVSPNKTQPIYFKSGQAPAILDTMSVLVYGYGSCSALSIIFVNALRTAGIPCRVVGTPAWYGNRLQGNHNWIEVYDSITNTWSFLESTPAALFVDTIQTNPCHRWFCTSDRFPKQVNSSNNNTASTTTTTTQVYAAKLDSSTTNTFFRLAWEWTNQDIPADDVTSYYQNICSQCPTSTTTTTT